MVLDLDRDDVPHFMEHVPPGQGATEPESMAAEQAERDWVAQRGLSIINVPIDGDATLDMVLASLGTWVRDTAVVLGGRSERGNCHSVVFYRGRVYDPSGPGCRLVGPQPSGFWFVTIYARATNPLPPMPQPASMATQETQ